MIQDTEIEKIYKWLNKHTQHGNILVTMRPTTNWFTCEKCEKQLESDKIKFSKSEERQRK